MNKERPYKNLQEVADELTENWNTEQRIKALEKEFHDELTRLSQHHSDEIFELKKDIAHMKPMVDAYYEKQAAFQFGRKLGNNVTWIGGVLAVLFAGIVAIWQGFQFALKEAAHKALENVDKLPPPGSLGGH